MQVKPSNLLFQFFICILGCFSATSALTQVTPDNTLDTQVNSDGNVSEITEGQTQGDNLFHSFQDFSVQTGNEAFFNNANNISNIFSRVTGGNISNIDGLIRANGNASLFLINPNGIIFGENAQLNIGGSFLGSTAESILFDEGQFSANLDTSPLLTINQPIGLGLPDNPATIVNRSTAPDSLGNSVGLEVSSGNNLSLVGGDLQFEGGNATASGGNVELVGLSQAGTIGISEDGSLTFPEDVAKANLSLSDGAVVDVEGSGGNITVNARNLDLTAGEDGNRSALRAGITSDSTSNDAQAGDIVINVSENITLDESRILNVNQGGIGDAGNINITAGTMKSLNGGRISSSIFPSGRGDAGNINITATGDITFDGQDSLGEFSAVNSRINPDGVGNAGNINFTTTGNIGLSNGTEVDVTGTGGGNITVNARNLDLKASSFLNAGITADSTSSNAQAGDIVISVTENITLDRSRIRNLVDGGGVGNSGKIDITTGSIEATNGGRISSSTFVGQGNAGGINLTAEEDITFSGADFRNDIVDPSGAFSLVVAGAEGNGGDINISAANLTLEDGGEVNASTGGRGNGGNIDITARNTISLNTGTIDGDTPNPSNSRNGIFTEVRRGALGNAGNTIINTDNLVITNGARIGTATFGQGDGGNINITASNITFEGVNFKSEPSSVGSRVEPEAVGNAGNVTIDTDNLTFANGGQINAGILGQGEGGDINITARENIDISSGDLNIDSGIFSTVNREAVGNAGNVTINTDNLAVANGGQISASTFGQGNAGDVSVSTEQLNISNGGKIEATNIERLRGHSPGIGQPGNITIEANSVDLINRATINAETQSETGESGIINLQVAEDLTLDNNSTISAQALENANGGNLTIDARFVIANPNSNSDIIASAEQGQGGNITIDANSIFGIEERPLNDLTNDINASSEFNSSGTVEIDILEVDPSQDTLNIPVATVETEVAQACESDENNNQSEFVVTGRSGLPDTPEASLNGNFTLEDWRVGESFRSVLRSDEKPSKVEAEKPESIVEADSWHVNRQGKVVLIADNSANQSDLLKQESADCHTE